MQTESRLVRIDIENQQMGAYLALPSGNLRGGLVVIQEIFGVTPAMRAIADDFATQGYAALVPDIYWRMQPGLDLGHGEDPATRDVAVAFSNRFDETLGTTDLVVSLDWLADHLGTGRPGVVGFCLGGRLAVRVAEQSAPACMVSMYGVKLDTLDAEIQRTKCPMQFHFGENDNHNPTSTIQGVRAMVKQRRRSADEFFTYPGAEHAFYNRFRTDRFNATAHQLARSRVIAFLARHLAEPGA